MKKIILILSFLVCAFISFAQGPFPVKQSLGSPTTLIKVNGAIKDSLAHILATWADTTTANLNPYIKFYPGAQIRTLNPTNSVWVRNDAATGWIKVATGSITSENFANTNLTFTGNRTHQLGSNFLFLNGTDGTSTNTILSSPGNISLNIATATESGELTLDNTSAQLLHSELVNIASNRDIDIEAGDSLRLVGINESASTGLYVPFLNPITGAVTKGDLFGQSLQPVGDRFNYLWANNPLNTWTDNTPGMTVTTNGTVTSVSGAFAFNLNNNFSLANNFFASHNFKIRFTAVVKQKDGASGGLGVLFSAQGAGNSFGAHFLLADTTGYVAFTDGASVPVYNGVNNRGKYLPKWNALDTCDFLIERIGQRAYISWTDRATKFKSFLQIPYVYGSVGALTLHFYGGNYDFVGDFNISYQDLVGNKFAVMGNSIAYGGNAYNESTKWPTIAFDGHKGGYVDLTASNEGSLQGTYRVQDVVQYIKPQYAILCYGVNDAHGGVSIDSFTARMTRIIEQLIAGGVTPIIATITPQGAVNVTSYNTVLQTLATTYSLRVLPFYNNMVAAAGTGMYTGYDPFDGIHPGQNGHNIEGFTARQGLLDLLDLESPINLKQIPVSNYAAQMLGVDIEGNLVSIPRGRDTTVINNLGENPSVINVQPGTINISGRIWGWNGMVITAPLGSGYPSAANGGMFSVNHNDDGFVKAINFESRGIQTFAGGAVLGNVSNPQVQIPSSLGAYLTGSFNDFLTITARGPQSSNLNMLWNTASGTANLSAFHHVDIYTNSVLRGYIGAYGDVHTDSNSGYRHPIAWADLGNNDWPTKRGVDSLLALVSGFANPMTTLGDQITGGVSGVAQRVGVGSESQVWTVVGGVPAWANSAAGFANPMTTLGDVITATTGGTAQRVGVGSEGQVFKVVSGVPAWANETAGSATWNGILDPTGDQALTFAAGESSTWTSSNTTEDLFTVNTSTLTTGSLFSFNSTSTTLAAGNNLAEFIMSGANGTNGITATAIRTNVTNTNATSGTNLGAAFSASGATTTNFAVLTGLDGTNSGRININNATNSANHTVLLKSINNTVDVGLLILANNETQSTAYSYNGIRGGSGLTMAATSGDLSLATSATSGNWDNNGQINLVASVGLSMGSASFTPTTWIDIGAGVTARGQLRFRAGVAPTSPNDGEFWYEDTNDRLMFRQNANSVELVGAQAVNTVSPTAPNRTITVVLNGTTYYISAKTSND